MIGLTRSFSVFSFTKRLSHKTAIEPRVELKILLSLHIVVIGIRKTEMGRNYTSKKLLYLLDTSRTSLDQSARAVAPKIRRNDIEE
ncbi:MAG TPA: hypothetical protein DD473_18995 [Planctomycetaceae bacterium]|nr:hypothetical protein [Planctomycetaceae bacterium]